MKKKLGLLIAGTMALTMLCACGEKKVYEEAVILYQEDQLAEAKDKFSSIADYEDSAEKIAEIETRQMYLEAVTNFENEEYEAALDAFSKLGEYEDAAIYVIECEKAIDHAKANELLATGQYEEAIEAFAELGDEENRIEAIYQYATALADAGKMDEAYIWYADIIDYKNTMSILGAYRFGDRVITESFKDDYGTEFSVNGHDYYNNELGVSLSFFKNEIVPEGRTDYYFDSSMEREWKRNAAHVKLVVDGDTIFSATINSGIPYCDVPGDAGTKMQWYCWYHFNITEDRFNNCDSAVLMYDDTLVYDFGTVRMASASAAEREDVYTRALDLFGNKEYYKAKEQFERLFNYEASDAYLELLNTYFDSILQKSLGNTSKLAADEARINEIVTENGIDFEF